MRISSPAFEDGEIMPSIYTCDADNMNPPLEISDVPVGTKSFALIMEDPDSPGEPFIHWMMWNIPADTKSIEENDWVDGAEQGINDSGELGYTGPCPVEGVHHYHFKLYALDKTLDLAGDITRVELETEIEKSLLEEAQLVGLYKLLS